MKKLVFAASLFVAVAVTAQKRGVEVQKDRVEYQHQQNDFYGIRLTSHQERQIKSLERERLNERAYEMRLKKILTKDQYFKYVQNQKKGGEKDKKWSITNLLDKKIDRKSISIYFF